MIVPDILIGSAAYGTRAFQRPVISLNARSARSRERFVRYTCKVTATHYLLSFRPTTSVHFSRCSLRLERGTYRPSQSAHSDGSFVTVGRPLVHASAGSTTSPTAHVQGR
jgi:hypothetical protein